jgi:plastocyanin
MVVVILAVAGTASYLAFSHGAGGLLSASSVTSASESNTASGTESSTVSSLTGTSSTTCIACSYGTTTSTSVPSSTSSRSTTTSSTYSNASEVMVIIPPGIENLANKVSFEPINITIVIGVNNTIVFVNHDDQEHILESTAWPTDGQPFQFYSLPGSSNSVTFTTPGKYTYFCEWHPIWMDGSINVVA